MGDLTPIPLIRGPAGRGSRKHIARSAQVFFDRGELSLILGLYGAKVAAGEWCDYAIGDDRGKAVFSVFRGSSSVPLYRIIKKTGETPAAGPYAVISASGHILKMDGSLSQTLKVFERTSLQLV